MPDAPAIHFRLDPGRSGVAPYLQLVHQVRRALLLDQLRPGDRLPTVKEVVGAIAINPNTVLKAYRELENSGLVEGRPGVGTFVVRGLDGPPRDKRAQLRRAFDRWLRQAWDAGFDSESISALIQTALNDADSSERIA